MSPHSVRLARWSIVAVVGLAVVAGAWWLIASLGPGASLVAAEDEVVLAQSDGETTDEPVVDAAIEVTYDVFLSRDPFESIRPPEPDPPATSTGNGTTGNGTTGNGTTGNGTTGNGTTGNGTTGNGNGGTDKDPLQIEVLAVTETGAEIRIGSTVYQPQVGDTFAGSFRLLRVVEGCAEIQQGDQVLPVLCVGSITQK